MLRYLTAGESHGKALVVIVEGLPAGLPITVDEIQAEMGRRRLGFGRGPRQRFEVDNLTLLGGVRHGRTLGSPVAIEIENTEWFRSDKWHEEMSPAPGATKEPLTQVRPGHADLGPVLERKLEPRGPWRFESPVVCLQGQKTFSSAESMALMFAQCPQVTTMGTRTGGSSANPRRIELEGGIQVNLPRWNDMDPAGKPIERVGVAPEVEIRAKPEEFTATQDPVLEAALASLRKTPESQRKPGKR